MLEKPINYVGSDAYTLFSFIPLSKSINIRGGYTREDLNKKSYSWTSVFFESEDIEVKSYAIKSPLSIYNLLDKNLMIVFDSPFGTPIREIDSFVFEMGENRGNIIKLSKDKFKRDSYYNKESPFIIFFNYELNEQEIDIESLNRSNL